jgi:hypothetical protein
MNPDHLLDQANLLIQASVAGAPRQVDLRRAISTAYYALFHFAMSAAADMAVSKAARRNNPDGYARAYQSINHDELVKRAQEARAVGRNIAAFADAIVALQQARHRADYDPRYRVSKSEAVAKVLTARAAIARFEGAGEEERKACLAMLLFKRRRP